MNKNKLIKSCFATAVLIALTLCLSIIGCGKAEKNDVIEIRETMFLTQTQEIYVNSKDYLGKTVKLEGIFISHEWNGAFWHYVIRYAPDVCCGDVANVGFEVKWPGNSGELYPENNSWVEATGILKIYDDNALRTLCLELTSLNVLDKRGVENVLR